MNRPKEHLDMYHHCKCITILCSLFLVLGCEGRVHIVEFILPDGFRGGIAVEVDENAGDEVVFENGRYVIPIGEDGRARIKRFVFSSYLSRAKFKSGPELWVEKRLGDIPPAGAVCLLDGFTAVESSIDENNQVTKKEERFWWFAGTHKEHDAWKGLKHKLGSVREK